MQSDILDPAGPDWVLHVGVLSLPLKKNGLGTRPPSGLCGYSLLRSAWPPVPFVRETLAKPGLGLGRRLTGSPETRCSFFCLYHYNKYGGPLPSQLPVLAPFHAVPSL